MLKRRVVFIVGLYHGGRRYELRFAELADFRNVGSEPREEIDRRVREALERYVRQIESTCVESPYNWFNFYDFWATDVHPAPFTTDTSS
jgi:predicted LPLAT superfamily acyltransferase